MQIIPDPVVPRAPIVILLASWTATAASAQGFTIDMSQQELRELETTVLADELAVNDIAYFLPWQLCIAEDQIFIPSTAVTRSADDNFGFFLAARMLPGKRFSVESKAPTKYGEFGRGDVVSLITSLADPTNFFSRSWSCAEYEAKSRWPVEFYQVVDIDGHTSLSALHEDLIGRDCIFDDPDDP